MFCPRCGEQQIAGDSRFCSRCGFLLTNVNNLLVGGGVLSEQFYNQPNTQISTRKKGVKQGGKMILAGLIIVPLLGILSTFIGFNTFIVGITALILFWGGVLRLIYALLFETGEDQTLEQKVIKISEKFLNKKQNVEALPEKKYNSASTYTPPAAGNWRDTKDFGKQNTKD